MSCKAEDTTMEGAFDAIEIRFRQMDRRATRLEAELTTTKKLLQATKDELQNSFMARDARIDFLTLEVEMLQKTAQKAESHSA